jgi:20S proteasome subunit alpha 5
MYNYPYLFYFQNQSDARTLVDHARIEAQNHTFNYDERMPVEALTQTVCDLALGFGEGGKKGQRQMSRPFGVALLMAGHDERGPQLYFSDPSGTYLEYKAKAIGAGSEGAQATLQDKYNPDMTLLQAEDLALEILKQVMEEKVNNKNIEVASVTDKGYHTYTFDELDTMIARV